MKVNEELISRTAKAARVHLTDADIGHLQKDLKGILEAFSKLDQIDTGNVKSSFHPISLKNIMREDVAKECLLQEEALKNTAHKKDGYFKGPKIV